MLFRDILMLSATQGTAGAYAPYALALDFKNGIYRQGALITSDPSTLSGYTYTRSGAKSEVATAGTIYPFAADVPGIVSGDGYWSRASLTNGFFRSQEFDDAFWTKSTGAVTANATVAPDGTTTADKYVPGASSNAHAISRAVTVSNATVYTISVFMKAAGYDFGYIRTGVHTAGDTYNNVYFDLINGTVAFTGFGTASIQSVGNGWYRCSVTLTTARTTTNFVFGVDSTNQGSATPTFTADGVKGINLWQAQFVASPQRGPIIVTTTATATVGADALSVSLANATYSAVYTFDDLSTQTISTVISGGAFAMPVYPTALNRPLVQLVTLRV